MRGLRFRLTLAIVLITLAASTVVGIGLGRYAGTQFERYFEVETELSPVELPDTAGLVAQLREGDEPGVETELQALAAAVGARLLLFGPDRELIVDTAIAQEGGASSPDAGSARGAIARGRRGMSSRGGAAGQDMAVMHADGRLEIRGSAEASGARRDERLVVGGGIPLGEPGARLGTLFVVPEMDEPVEAPATGFTRTIGRAHLIGVLVATGIAFVIALVLSGRIVGPVETLTGAARRLAAGDLGQRVAVRAHDEIGELSRAFNAMADALERQERVRRNMVSDIAHELRTPLTHLRCKLESVQDGLAAADDSLLDGLHREIVHLGRLVDDLQELALAEAGRLPLHPTETDLVPVTRQLVATLPAADGGPVVIVEASAALAPVRVDVDRFRQVLRNLLQNALRHGSAGGRVVVRLIEADPDGVRSAVRCEVRDDGPGIPPEARERIFDRFYRTDPSRDRATGGAGLGLAIVRQLVLAWGGAVGVESVPGSGATFWFTVPRG